MDKIEIKEIQIYGYHGLFESEKQAGQQFSVDCEISVDTSMCKEEILRTVHYGEVTMDIVKFFTKYRFDLLETLANELSKYLLIKYPLIQELKLCIHKPHAPIQAIFGDVSLTVTRKRNRVYLGIGSNLGDRTAHLELACNEVIKDGNIKLIKKSTFVETAPYGVLDQPNFLNGVLDVETIYTPQELLEFCHKTEKIANRVKERVWGERTLDVDILMFGDEVIYTDTLKIPHPELHMRKFVLHSMVEIEPYLVHPIKRLNMLEMYNNLAW